MANLTCVTIDIEMPTGRMLGRGDFDITVLINEIDIFHAFIFSEFVDHLPHRAQIPLEHPVFQSDSDQFSHPGSMVFEFSHLLFAVHKDHNKEKGRHEHDHSQQNEPDDPYAEASQRTQKNNPPSGAAVESIGAGGEIPE